MKTIVLNYNLLKPINDLTVKKSNHCNESGQDYIQQSIILISSTDNIFIKISFAHFLITPQMFLKHKRLIIHTFGLSFSTNFESMTMVELFCSHTILQKSPQVSGRGPCVAMQALCFLYPSQKFALMQSEPGMLSSVWRTTRLWSQATTFTYLFLGLFISRLEISQVNCCSVSIDCENKSVKSIGFFVQLLLSIVTTIWIASVNLQQLFHFSWCWS